MKTKLLIHLAAGFGLLASAQAAVVVEFGGTGMVSANQNLSGSGAVLDPNVAISPSAGYVGQRFHGASTNTGNSTIIAWSIFNDLAPNTPAGTKDWIGLTGASATDTASKFHTALVLFKQADFSEHSSLAGGVTLNDQTPLSFHAKRNGGSPSSIGFVIQTSEPGNPYYITTKTYVDNAIPGGGGEIFTLADPTSGSWSLFTPETSLRTIGASATPDFTKVTALGVWFDNERTATSTSNFAFYVSDINLQAVPEPSTYAALMGALALGVVMYRRRRG